MTLKRVLCPAQVRRVPRQFSWIDQRLVRDKYVSLCSADALALYLFLVTVADAQGLSYYADHSLVDRLPFDGRRLAHARGELQRVGLIAYQTPLYQVLALDDPKPPPLRTSPTPPAPAARRAAQPTALIEMLRRALGGPHDQL